ncbi:hypothetical protein ACQP3J_33500, partial [Escherichia coli]
MDKPQTCAHINSFGKTQWVTNNTRRHECGIETFIYRRLSGMGSEDNKDIFYTGIKMSKNSEVVVAYWST